MAAWLDVCRYAATAGGTADFTYNNAVTGYQSPAAAGVVNSTVYRYRAETADLTQWEVGFGAYNTGTGVLARTTVLYNSSATGTGAGQSGAGTKINFGVAPQVAIVALAEDLIGFVAKTGDTMTGNLTVSGNDIEVILNSLATSNTVYPRVRYTMAGVPRWEISAAWGLETGSNIGSDFSIDRYNDAGVYIESPIAIARGTGLITLLSDIHQGKVNPVIGISKTATGQHSALMGKLGGLLRWQVSIGNANPESSGNAGSDFSIYRYTDAGTFIGEVFSINRATGATTVSAAFAVTSNFSVTGDTITYGSGGAGAVLNFNLVGGTGANGGTRDILYKGGVTKWQRGIESAIFGGGSTSDNYVLYNSPVGRAITVQASDSGVVLGSTTASSSTTTGALVVSGGIGCGSSVVAVGAQLTNLAAGGANLTLNGDGGSNPNKTIRASLGLLQFVNSAYSAVIMTLTDAGDLSFTGSAWTVYTPTVTVTGGSATGTGYYKQLGKTLHIKVTCNITATGTSLNFTLPGGMTFANGSQYVFGREQAINGFMWCGRCDGATATATCQRYDNNTSANSGMSVVFTGTVEIA